MRPPLRNLLHLESSPYLLQHQDNPVQWWAWHDQAFAQAQQQNKPILLSIGYSACHWCHVMAHESFENEAVAALMNEHFINIKVDREERPDLDHYYQMALRILGAQGGWPLTMFLTPQGVPFWGGTYFPPQAKYNRPGMTQLLPEIAHVYQTRVTELADIGHQINQRIATFNDIVSSSGAQPITLDDCNAMAEHLLTALDPINGGLSGAPKFPQPSLFALIWRAYERTQDQRFKTAFLLYLTKISQGGIYDHLGGGFARYATDEQWLIPHFEKMLYDNAQLVELLAWGWQASELPMFKQHIEQTVAWLAREMQHPQGGFYSAQDADAEGIEGKFYVWSATEIDKLLGDKSEELKKIYDVSTHGNWEETTILNLLQQSPEYQDSAQILAQKAILLQARQQRIYPQRDDKILTDWNGLTIASLAQLSAIFVQPQWLLMAEQAFTFITNFNTTDKLVHSWCAGKSLAIVFSDDYAAMIKAALQLYQITGNTSYLVKAEVWLTILQQEFQDKDGLYFKTAQSTKEMITLPRCKEIDEGVIPSSNALIFEAAVKLYLLTENQNYLAMVEKLLSLLQGRIQQHPHSHATLLNAIDLWQRPLIATLYTHHDDPEHVRWIQALYQEAPSVLLIKHAITEKPTHVILCQDKVCGAPIFERDQLKIRGL